MHIFCGSTPDMGLPAPWGGPGPGIVGDTMAHGGIVATIGQRLCGGVTARHPQLTFVCAACETGWLGPVLQRLHQATYRARGAASPDLTMEPSASFQHQFYATFEDNAIGVLPRYCIGVDNLIWGNDSLRHDSIWPHSQEVITRIFAGVSEEEKTQRTFGNVTTLYGLTPPGAAAASRRLFTHAALLGQCCLSRWWLLQLHNIPAG